jgi:hypothetical protein
MEYDPEISALMQDELLWEDGTDFGAMETPGMYAPPSTPNIPLGLELPKLCWGRCLTREETNHYTACLRIRRILNLQPIGDDAKCRTKDISEHARPGTKRRCGEIARPMARCTCFPWMHQK